MISRAVDGSGPPELNCRKPALAFQDVGLVKMHPAWVPNRKAAEARWPWQSLST